MAESSADDGVLSVDGAAHQETRRKRRIHLRLWVNGVAYEHNRKCDFCDEKPASKHCPYDRCGFVCDGCDEYRHENPLNVAYQSHRRAKVSRLTLAEAGAKIQGFVWFVHLRRLMREAVRRRWERFYDPERRRHFYFDKRTRRVSWTKPRLLGREELRPFLTLDEAAFKMQQLLRNWKAREAARCLLRRVWERIYDPNSGNFYYFYGGKSPLVQDHTRWTQPCRVMGAEWIWRPVLTEAFAAYRIYRMWEATKGRRYIRNIIRQIYVRRKDAVTGAYVYTNKRTGLTRLDKPVLLGSEAWDPNAIEDWSVEDVVLFLRRCGLRAAVPTFRRFGIDGGLLLTLDPQDYHMLGIESPLAVKRLHLALETKPGFGGYSEDTRDLLRRAALRQRYAYERHAICIQQAWRNYLAAKVRHRLKFVVSEKRKQMQRERKREAGLKWWFQREEPQAYIGAALGTKNFGRRAMKDWAKGWGSYDVNGSWIAAAQGYSGDDQSSLSRRIVQEVELPNRPPIAISVRPKLKENCHLGKAMTQTEEQEHIHVLRQYFF